MFYIYGSRYLRYNKAILEKVASFWTAPREKEVTQWQYQNRSKKRFTSM